ncbi:MAG: methyltransferase [Pseudomonadota bacterium]
MNQIVAAINDPTRPDTHRERDPVRKPGEILTLAEVRPGDRVADLAAAGGYYTAIASRVVGDRGHVYAVDPERIFEYFPKGREGFPAYQKSDPRQNVSYSVQKFDALVFPKKLDAVLMVLYYHDTLWTGEDRAAMNLAMFHALKPGGRLVIVDHTAKEDSGDNVPRELHRMRESLLLPEVKAAGFRVIDKSASLRNPDDPQDTSVFDPAWRGKTDRFVYVFERP